MDKTGHFLWNSIHPESLKLICDRLPYAQSQDAAWSIDGLVFNDYDLFICTSGSAKFSINQTSWILSGGEALLLPRDTPIYAKLHGQNNFCALAQHFELKLFGEEDFFSFVRYRPHVILKNWDWLEQIVVLLGSILDDSEGRQQRYALFYLILTEFLNESCLGLKEDTDPSTGFILEIVGEIDRRYKEDLTLESLLKRYPYSPDYTNRLFKRKMGRPIKQYIIYRRLQNSKDLMARGVSVKEAAYSSGFHDELYFSRVFRKYEGSSPSQYRGRIGNKIK